MIKDGKFSIQGLAPTTHVKLSQYSARIPAHQTHTFAYQVTCDTYPCVVAVLADVGSGHTDEGVAVIIRMTHIVYACNRERDCRKSTISQ
jgi:hypothetical protein